MKKTLCLLFSLICFSGAAGAAPGQSMLKMMRTPVTVFDFFLFQLEESCKCDKWFGNPNWKSDPCMTLLEYHIEEDSIYAHFYVHDPSRSTTYMRGFVNGNESQKEQIMRMAIERLAIVFGVSVRPGMEKAYGLIQITPIRRGWYNPDFEESALKNAVAARTVLTLQTRYEGKLYHVERRLDGRVHYEVSDAEKAREEKRGSDRE